VNLPICHNLSLTNHSARPVGHYVDISVLLFARSRPPLAVLGCNSLCVLARQHERLFLLRLCIVRLRLCVPILRNNHSFSYRLSGHNVWYNLSGHSYVSQKTVITDQLESWQQQTSTKDSVCVTSYGSSSIFLSVECLFAALHTSCTQQVFYLQVLHCWSFEVCVKDLCCSLHCYS